ncbi:MAG: hypothetical protein WCO33_02570 [bacterium]
MKIYYTCSTAEFKKYRNTYFGIRKFLIDQNHVLTRDWLPHTEKLIDEGNTEIRDIKEIYKACVEAIRDSDAVVIEDTVSNFSTGHQITLALEMRKPTLVLWKGKKHRQFNQMFIHGIDSDLLEVKEYADKDLEKIIRVFLKKYENVDEKNRFHLVLSNPERMYLDFAQFRYGKSRTNIIRNALRKIIDSDKDYQKYLEK